MLGLIVGLVFILPLAVYLRGVVGWERWAVSVLFLGCALALHLIALRLQMYYIRTRAPHLIAGDYVHSDGIEFVPKWTTQFTGGVFAAILGIAFVWVLRFH